MNPSDCCCNLKKVFLFYGIFDESDYFNLNRRSVHRKVPIKCPGLLLTVLQFDQLNLPKGPDGGD